jgi:hypothetical protein
LKFSNYVNSIDSSLKSCLERILNLRLTVLQWCQFTLLTRFGGLGIRRISDICLPAFLYSINGVKCRQDGAARRRIITGSQAQLGHRITGH